MGLPTEPKIRTGRKSELFLNKNGLTPQQEEFCQLYAGSMYGNGTQSYVEAFEPDQSKPNWYKSAAVAASTLLKNPKVCKRITDLLDKEGWNDENMDKQALFVATQFEDLSSKMRAIEHYAKLKKRIEEKNVSNTLVINATPDQLERIATQILKKPESNN